MTLPPQLQDPKESLCVETILAIHLRPALLSAFPYIYMVRSRLDLSHVRHTSERCVCTADWLHARVKYSPDALPVKQIASVHKHGDEDYIEDCGVCT